MTDVLTYAQSLCEALDCDYRMFTVKSHRNSINKSVDDWSVSYHQKCLDQIRNDTYDYGKRFYIVESRKYLRIEEETGVNHDNSVKQKSIHCFIDKKTGEVYKSASWKSPAKGVRFDLRNIKQREWLFAHADWAGGYLYNR